MAKVTVYDEFGNPSTENVNIVDLSDFPDREDISWWCLDWGSIRQDDRWDWFAVDSGAIFEKTLSLGMSVEFAYPGSTREDKVFCGDQDEEMELILEELESLLFSGLVDGFDYDAEFSFGIKIIFKLGDNLLN